MTGTMVGMETTKALGARIRAARIAAGHSVQSAARDSGIARDTWRKIEQGASVQDTKRHIAMQFLGMLDDNEEHAAIANIDDYAVDRSGHINMNQMFIQAIRFAATVGDLIPDLHDEAERVAAATSELYAASIRIVQATGDLDDLQHYEDDDMVLLFEGKRPDESDPYESLPAVASTESLIEGAGEFDDEHTE